MRCCAVQPALAFFYCAVGPTPPLVHAPLSLSLSPPPGRLLFPRGVAPSSPLVSKASRTTAPSPELQRGEASKCPQRRRAHTPAACRALLLSPAPVPARPHLLLAGPGMASRGGDPSAARVSRSLRKQLAIAREARRVDVLCERLSLSHRMVKGSEHDKEIISMIGSAVRTLEKEVGGALDQVSAIMGRGIVNRLSCGAEVQKLCSSALEIVESTVDNTLEFELNNNPKILGPQPQILFDEITPFSVVIMLKYQDAISKEHIDGCKVWHRSAQVHDYSPEPTCHILRPNTRSLISGLSPSTEYFFRVSPFGSIEGFTEWETKCTTRSLDHGSSQCSTQNSDSVCLKGDSTQHQKRVLNLQNHQGAIQYDSPKGSTNSSENNLSCDRYSKRTKIARLDGASDNDESQLPPTSEVLPFASSNSSPSEAPSKPDLLIGTPDSSSKNYVEQQYEYCVKVIRWLEHEGHMDSDFRVKFLTWFSLKATAQDRRIVGAFVDALISDPASLVAQLVDAFMDVVCIKEKPPQPQQKGACCKLWH
nr:unnamed protein product [Digitaria exilis]